MCSNVKWREAVRYCLARCLECLVVTEGDDVRLHVKALVLQLCYDAERMSSDVVGDRLNQSEHQYLDRR